MPRIIGAIAYILTTDDVHNAKHNYYIAPSDLLAILVVICVRVHVALCIFDEWLAPEKKSHI